MTGAHIKYSVGGASVGLEFGDLKWITEHTGFDKVSYVDVRFEHGLLQMTSESLAILARQAQTVLAEIPNVRGAV